LEEVKDAQEILALVLGEINSPTIQAIIEPTHFMLEEFRDINLEEMPTLLPSM
jgi:hypothetical protein